MKMKRRNGFIAVSMIYSFFLVFLMIMLASTTKNAQTRQLLRVYKDDIKSELNEKEFIVIRLPKEDTYEVNEELDFIGDTWQVIENKENSVVLILKRPLNKKEITKALEITEEDTDYFNGTCTDDACSVRMCLNKLSLHDCFFDHSTNYVYYNWENSIAKTILNRYLEQNVNLQKICRSSYDNTENKLKCTKDKLMEMTFSDGIEEHTGYIRLATKDEISTAEDWTKSAGQAWSLSIDSRNNGYSNIYSFGENISSVVAHNVALQIRPVIEVKKS